MAIGYTLEGFNLHQPDIGFRLLEGTEFASTIAPRRVNISVPNMHGEVPMWNDPLDTTTLALRVRISDPSPEGLQQKWHYLRSLCRTGSNNPVTIRRLSGDNEVTSTFAQLQSMDTPDFYCAAGMVTTTMLFHIPSGRWEDINDEIVQLAIPGADQEVPFASESSGPITNLLVQVKGPLTRVIVRDNTNDTGVEWRAFGAITDIASDEYLLIDCANFEARRNTTDAWDEVGEGVTARLLTVGNGMLTLVPQPSFVIGDSTSSVTVTAAGHSAATEIRIRGRRTYI